MEGKRRRGRIKLTDSQQAKFAKVMHEFKEGTLRSSSGQRVTSSDQAVAIAMNEARRHQ